MGNIAFDFDRLEWDGIEVDYVKRLEALYPDVDVIDIILKETVEWLTKNRTNRKAHKRNWDRFLVGWISREQQKAAFSVRA